MMHAALISMLLASNAAGAGNLILVHADTATAVNDGETVLLDGSVVIRDDTIVLSAEHILFGREGGVIHAETDVVVAMERSVVSGASAEYSTSYHTGTVRDAELLTGPWRVNGELITMSENYRLTVQRAHITTCDAPRPHYEIIAHRLNVYPESRWASLQWTSVRLLGIPVFAFPYLGIPLIRGGVPFRIRVGRSDYEGTFVKMTYGYDLLGTGDLHLDYRSHRGWGYGIDHAAVIPKGEFETSLYRIDERNADARYRARLYLSVHPVDRLRIFTDIHDLSDRAFREDYFYDEYIRTPEPESRGAVVWRGDAYAAQARVVGNTNRLQWPNQVERLPEARLALHSYPIARTGAYLRADASAVNFRTGDEFGFDTEVSRLDGTARIFWPLHPHRGWTLTPFAGIEGTRWSDSDARPAGANSTESISRVLPSAGAELATLRRIELGGTRHLVRPAIGLTYTSYHGDRYEDIPYRDGIDSNRDGLPIVVKFDDHIVTRARRGGRRTARIELDAGYDPDLPDDRFLPIRLDARAWPSDSMTLELELEHDPNDNVMERLSGLILIERPWWRASASVSRSNGGAGEDDLLSLGGEAEARLGSNWSGFVSFSFDAEEGELDYAEYGLRRNLHCLLLDVSLRDERTVERTTFFVSLGLAAFPERTTGLSVGVGE